VAGAYRIEAPLGSGGFGSVFRAQQVRTGLPVALKLLHQTLAGDPEGVARFHREAKLAMRLSHPTVVKVMDAGFAEDGTPFIAFELLEGATLESTIARGAMDDKRVVGVISPLLEALHEAHKAGIVHRDVKPANVFLTSAGDVKLLDFGVAKASAAGTLHTAAGAVLGTPMYMAPEQLTGAAVVPATDLYAVGLLAAEMLGGRPVFGESIGAIVADKVAGRTPELDPRVRASRLAPILTRALKGNPAERFSSAEEMLWAVRTLGTKSGKSELEATVIDNREEPSAPVHVRIAAGRPAKGIAKTEPLRLEDLPSAGPYPPGTGRPTPAPQPVQQAPHAPQAPGTPEPIALANVTGVSPSRVAPVPRWLWLLLLVPFVAAGVVAALYWRSRKLRAVHAIGDAAASASADSPAHPLPEIPAPANARDGRTIACDGADKHTWESLRSKMPDAAKAGAVTNPQANVEIGQAGDVSLRFYDTRGKKRADRIAKAGADLGWLALVGTKKAILVDAPADKREAIRAAACD